MRPTIGKSLKLTSNAMSLDRGRLLGRLLAATKPGGGRRPLSTSQFFTKPKEEAQRDFSGFSVVHARSAGALGGDFAEITINDVPIECTLNESANSRGLHIVVLDGASGEVESAKIFDTYRTSVSIDNFIKETSLPDGHVVVAACRDDCAKGLSENAKQWFSDMGSKEIWKLAYR